VTGSFEFVLSITGNSKSEDAMRIGRFVSTIASDASVSGLVLDPVQAEIDEVKQVMTSAIFKAHFTL
jgi:hypothetical protein